MPRRVALLGLSLILSTAIAYAANPESTEKATELFQKGRALLAAGDFAGAAAAYEAAAAADPEELNYQVSAAVLKRVISLREALPRLDGTPKWAPAIKAIYAYCLENHAFTEALKQAAALHAKQADGESAAMVARVHLEQGEQQEAIAVLDAVSPEKRTNETWTLLGIALARSGDVEKARAAAQAVKPADAPDPALLFDGARLCSLLGDGDAAVKHLISAFENTPPSRLEVVRTQARECADLAALHALPVFESALATKSKVIESKCSSGASCDQCPSRATCESSKEKEKKP